MLSRANSIISFLTRLWVSADLMTPLPSVASSLVHSNCGFTKLISVPCGFTNSQAWGSTFRKEINERSITTIGNGEFGISSGNILDYTAVDKTFKQVNADKFLENIRVQYLDPGYDYTKDRYKLWDRVNEDTYNDWQLGAFKHCPFGPAFDQWQLRPNTEQIVFDYQGDGIPYVAKASKTLPNFVLDNKSSVAYHTQVENDFLRFHLSDVPNRFESAQRRITKNIPNGYKLYPFPETVTSGVNLINAEKPWSYVSTSSSVICWVSWETLTVLSKASAILP